MAKSKTPLIEDPDLLAPKLSRDEIQNDEPTKSQLKKAIVNVDPIPMAPPMPMPLPDPSPMAPPIPMPGAMPSPMPMPGAMPSPAPAAQNNSISNFEMPEVSEAAMKESEHWVKAYWRPAMGWLYMLICLCDFVVFPAIAMFLPVFFKGIGVQLAYSAWVSLTLSNGGLIHMAFGAILGVAAYGRTQEKVAAKN
jgi:hypothetical protein